MQRLMSSRQVLAATLATLALIATTAPTHATTIDWSGLGTDSNYTNGANWVGNTAPAHSDYTDKARFGETAASAGTITAPSSRKVNSLIFTSAGWTISSGSFDVVRVVNSKGAGTNTISSPISSYQGSSYTWTIESGNTLKVSSLYQRGKDITLKGGGTLNFGSAIDGYGSSGWYLKVDTGTVVFDSSSPYTFSTGGAVRIVKDTGIVHVQTDVSGAQGLIDSGRIIGLDNDNNALDLVVTDIGGGYSQVTVSVPEPASLALMGLGGVLCLWRRQSH